MARRTTQNAHSERSPHQRPPKVWRPLPEEQETVIRWDRASDTVSIYSADPAVWRRLEKAGLPTAGTVTTLGKESGRTYLAPKATFRFKPAGRAVRA